MGEVKKELAFHGDVLNTASRIQGKCAELDSRLLISDELCGLLEGLQGFQFQLVGSVDLKGKAEPVVVHRASPLPGWK